MREIKFRAWDKDLKGWIVEKIFFSEGKAYIIRGRIMVECKNADIVQYTNLKDKNGKEVYEGDRIMYRDDRMYEVRWSDVNSGFWSGTAFPLTKAVADDCKVIGNIYQYQTQSERSL